MILSVSKRTDIPAFYAEWFMYNLRLGAFQVRNPYFPKQVSEYRFTKDVVDAIVFWTKNPQPLFRFLEELKRDYNCLYMISLNDYPESIEANLPALTRRIHDFQELSMRTKPGSVIWRYDPIIFTDAIGVQEHIRSFTLIAKALSGHTKRCIISIVDEVSKAGVGLRSIMHRNPKESELNILIQALKIIAEQYGITLQGCAEEQLEKYGLPSGACIDQAYLNDLFKLNLDVTRSNERKGCHCIKAIDIGAYDTCLNGCAYCYANHSRQTSIQNMLKHEKTSKMLVGKLSEEDELKVQTETKALSKTYKKISFDL